MPALQSTLPYFHPAPKSRQPLLSATTWLSLSCTLRQYVLHKVRGIPSCTYGSHTFPGSPSLVSVQPIIDKHLRPRSASRTNQGARQHAVARHGTHPPPTWTRVRGSKHRPSTIITQFTRPRAPLKSDPGLLATTAPKHPYPVRALVFSVLLNS